MKHFIIIFTVPCSSLVLKMKTETSIFLLIKVIEFHVLVIIFFYNCSVQPEQSGF